MNPQEKAAEKAWRVADKKKKEKAKKLRLEIASAKALLAKVEREKRKAAEPPKRKRVPPKQPTPLPPKEVETSGCRRTVAWALGIATLMGGIAAFVTFYPRPNISDSDPVVPEDALSASFIVSNSGFISLRHVDIGLGLGELSFGPPPIVKLKGPGEAGARMEPTRWTNRYLGFDDKIKISPSEIFGEGVVPPGKKLVDGHIVITIGYNPWFFPHREKFFRFRTFKHSNGHLYWQSETEK